MADGTDQGSDAGSSYTDELLIAEGEQVLEVSTTAGNDDDIDFRVCIKFLNSGNNFRNCLVALHLGVDDLELHLWPAQVGILEHVLLGIRVLTGNQTNALRQEGQWNLTVSIEETFFGELCA